jgi:hypothetical protein
MSEKEEQVKKCDMLLGEKQNTSKHIFLCGKKCKLFYLS